jgi:hypothetical protein
MLKSDLPMASKANCEYWAQDVRDRACHHRAFDRDRDGKPDPSKEADRMPPRQRVAVPSHFFEIVLRETQDGEASATGRDGPVASSPSSRLRRANNRLTRRWTLAGPEPRPHRLAGVRGQR